MKIVFTTPRLCRDWPLGLLLFTLLGRQAILAQDAFTRITSDPVVTGVDHLRPGRDRGQLDGLRLGRF